MENNNAEEEYDTLTPEEKKYSDYGVMVASIENKDIKTFLAALSRLGDPNWKGRGIHEPIIFLVYRNGTPEMLEALIAKGARLDLWGEGDTLLHNIPNTLENLKVLLKYINNLEILNRDNFTPLGAFVSETLYQIHSGNYQDYFVIIEELLKNGANPYAKYGPEDTTILEEVSNNIEESWKYFNLRGEIEPRLKSLYKLLKSYAAVHRRKDLAKMHFSAPTRERMREVEKVRRTEGNAAATALYRQQQEALRLQRMQAAQAAAGGAGAEGGAAAAAGGPDGMNLESAPAAYNSEGNEEYNPIGAHSTYTSMRKSRRRAASRSAQRKKNSRRAASRKANTRRQTP